MTLPKNKLFVWPLTADLLAIALFFVLFAPLRNLLADQTARGWLVVAAVYFFFCLAMNGLKKLRPLPAERPVWLTKLDVLANTKWAAVAAVLMAIAITMVQADLNQLVESAQLLAQSPGVVHEGEVSLYYAFGPTFLWIILGLFYVLVMVTKVEQKFAPETAAYASRYFWGALMIDGLALVLAAYAGSLVGRAARPLTTAELVLIFAGCLLAAGLLLDPARLFHFNKQPSLWPLLTYIAFILLCMFGIVLS